jgi:hypothetical protein
VAVVAVVVCSEYMSGTTMSSVTGVGGGGGIVELGMESED